MKAVCYYQIMTWKIVFSNNVNYRTEIVQLNRKGSRYVYIIAYTKSRDEEMDNILSSLHSKKNKCNLNETPNAKKRLGAKVGKEREDERFSKFGLRN